MERKIPELHKSICTPLIGYKKENRTDEKYLEKISEFERKIEKEFIKLLRMVDVRGTVKSDPYSLPFNKEIIVELKGESWMNGPYEYPRVFKKILKQIINEDYYKIRFYFFVNIITEIPKSGDETNLLKGIAASFGKIQYCFRYHIPE